MTNPYIIKQASQRTFSQQKSEHSVFEEEEYFSVQSELKGPIFTSKSKINEISNFINEDEVVEMFCQMRGMKITRDNFESYDTFEIVLMNETFYEEEYYGIKTIIREEICTAIGLLSSSLVLLFITYYLFVFN